MRLLQIKRAKVVKISHIHKKKEYFCYFFQKIGIIFSSFAIQRAKTKQ